MLAQNSNRQKKGTSCVYKQYGFGIHTDIHEHSPRPSIPKEIPKCKVNEQDFEEPDLENNHEHPLYLNIDQEEDLKECTSEYSFDISIF